MSRLIANFLILLLAPSLLAASEMHVTRMNLPVAWQLTRTVTLGGNATTLTESFRETWVLDAGPSGMVNFSSPRATVPVYTNSEGASVTGLAYGWICIKQGDLARLLGLVVDTGYEQDDQTIGRLSDRLVFIQIGRSDRYSSGMNLNWSFDQHFVVHIDIGTHVAL
jgi:hypothetical protein